MDSDNGMINGKRQIESNVTRIARAIKPESDDGVQQVVYYHKGIAVGGNAVDRYVHGRRLVSFFARLTRPGAIGEGLNENVREAYSFLSNNYAAGDEIYLIGFSRGAFTARTVAGIMDVVGLLTKRGLSYLGEIFNDVLHLHDRGYRSRFPDVPFRDKPSAADPRYAQELHRASSLPSWKGARLTRLEGADHAGRQHKGCWRVGHGRYVEISQPGSELTARLARHPAHRSAAEPGHPGPRRAGDGLLRHQAQQHHRKRLPGARPRREARVLFAGRVGEAARQPHRPFVPPRR
jgi:hypothetical protein